MGSKRLIYVDLLRILATFAVIVIHVTASSWYDIEVTSFNWKILNLYDSVVRFAVPIFVMISGIFFLDENRIITYKDIYHKYSARIVIKYLVWSFFYALYTSVYYYLKDGMTIVALTKEIVFKTLLGHYHMWFLLMIVGLYIISPLLRKIVIDKKATEYFLIVSVVFAVLIPSLLKIPILSGAQPILDNFRFSFTLKYVGYFIAGYYLNKYDISSLWRRLIYLLGVLGLMATMIITNLVSVHNGKACVDYYSNFSINVMLVGIGIFVFFKYEVSRIKLKEKALKIVTLLSSCSLGIYLVHAFYIELLTVLGINHLNKNTIIMVPAVSVMVLVLCFITTVIIKKLPKVNYFI